MANPKDRRQGEVGIVRIRDPSSNAKYYLCDVAIPGVSRNLNVYREEDLRLAAAELMWRSVDLNHVESRPLQGVEIVDAGYEDGRVKAIIKVPDGSRDWKGRDIQDAIDHGEIRHVSHTGYKNGFHYTGLALLDRDQEPGIPRTRISRSIRIKVRR